MLRAIALLVFAASAHAAIFPDTLGIYKKIAPKTVSALDQALYDEYGLDGSEQAEYIAPKKHFMATAWRFRDSTGAMATFESRRSPGSEPLGKLSFRTPDGLIFAYGNYVFELTGDVPPPQTLTQLYAHVPKFENSPLPVLMSDLPPDGLVPNSERYILGPVSLDRFDPKIPPSVAAFHLGSEGVVGKYRTNKGLLTLAIFDYPTPNLARDRYQEFQKIPRAVDRRVGDLVAVTIDPPDADAAERVLSSVKYEANITSNQHVPVNDTLDKVKFILNVFIFSGLLIALCLAAGLLYGGFRVLSRKMNRGEDPDALITLHLN